MRYDQERGRRRGPGRWEPAEDGERRRWHDDDDERHGGRGRPHGRGRHFAGPFGGPSELGQVLSGADQEKLKLSDDQKQQLRGLQKEADNTIDAVLKDEQKKQVKGMQEMFKAFGGFGPPGFGGGFRGNPVFRAYRYGRDYPGLAGRDLAAGKTIEELQP